MRRIYRIWIVLASLAAAAALATAPAAAGNWAESSIIDGGGSTPTAGEERELRVLLLQHGITPVDHGDVELSAWLPGTDERITVPAAHVGGGEWVATVTFPTSGEWQLRVMHSTFETPQATAFAVRPSSALAWLPATGSIAAMLLVALALIVAAHRIGGRLASEPARQTARAG
jgi:YtkA-like